MDQSLRLPAGELTLALLPRGSVVYPTIGKGWLCLVRERCEENCCGKKGTLASSARYANNARQ